MIPSPEVGQTAHTRFSVTRPKLAPALLLWASICFSVPCEQPLWASSPGRRRAETGGCGAPGILRCHATMGGVGCYVLSKSSKNLDPGLGKLQLVLGGRLLAPAFFAFASSGSVRFGTEEPWGHWTRSDSPPPVCVDVQVWMGSCARRSARARDTRSTRGPTRGTDTARSDRSGQVKGQLACWSVGSQSALVGRNAASHLRSSGSHRSPGREEEKDQRSRSRLTGQGVQIQILCRSDQIGRRW